MSQTSKARVISREFKLSAVRRMLAGENVSALSRELGVLRKDLYVWRERFRAGGPEALRPPGRPRKTAPAPPPASSKPPPDPPPDRVASELAAARRRIAELEGKIGRQHLELDFFRQALRQVGGRQRPKGKAGGTASTPSSKR
jgi:transposase-like protein